MIAPAATANPTAAPTAGALMPLGQIMTGQIISKLVLSTIVVPVLIQIFVSLGRRLDRTP